MRNLTTVLVLVLSVGCGDGTVGGGGRTPPGGRGPAGPGVCVPFEAYPGYHTCLLSLPQDGTRPVGPEVPRDVIAGSTSPLLRDRAPSPLPGSVNMRSDSLDGCLRVHDQGRCGWCAPHAITGALEALYCSKCGQTPDISPSHGRWIGNGRMDFAECESGWDTTAGMQIYADNEMVSLDEWPYVDNAGSLNGSRPTDSTLMMRGRYGATGVGTVDTSSLSAIKEQLATGRPVVIAVPVHQSNGWGSGTVTQVDAGKCTCGAAGCTDSNCIRGYHAVVITGYDDATMQFTFLNSWGRGWGDSGFGTMPYDFVTRHASSGRYFRDVKNADVMGCTMPDAGPRMDGGPGGGDAGPGGTGTGTRCNFSDCNTCGRTAGCGWCASAGRCQATGTTCAGGTLATSPERCDLSMDPCHSETSCSSCLARAGEGCGWCSGGSECISWRSNPLYCSGVRTEAIQCANCTGDCTSCLMTAGCGFCANNNRCVLAYGSHPLLPDDTCGSSSMPADFRTMGQMCPMPDAGPGGGDAGPGGRDSGPGGDRCAMGGDCNACNGIAGCGYCNSTGACMSDTRRSECPTAEWRDSRGSCADCSVHAACRECIFDGNCGWCNSTGTCLTAGPGGTPLTPCADFNYTNPDMCM